MIKTVRILTSLAIFCWLAGIASAQTTIYSSDFEADDGGWTSAGFGDWEHGVYDVNNYVGDSNPPPAATSGTSLWATVLNDDYTNSGDFSFMNQSFDLSGYVDAEMSWENWAEVFFSFDTAKLIVNGDVLYERTTSAAPTDWEKITVDLTPYVGGTADISFELFASTVVDRAGWYVDDIEIVGNLIPEPATGTLLAFACLGLLGLGRRTG